MVYNNHSAIFILGNELMIRLNSLNGLLSASYMKMHSLRSVHSFESKCLICNRLYDISTMYVGLILGLRPASERRRYKVTPSLIGWAQT